MQARLKFLEQIQITQRQAVLGVLALYFTSTVFLILIELAAQVSGMPVILPGAMIGSILFGGAWIIYYKTSWEPIRYAAALASSLLVGLFLPEPFVSIYAPMVVVVPAVLALLLTEPFWVIVNSVLTVSLLLMRAGGNGVYANPTTIILYTMIVGALIVSRLIEETTLYRLKRVEEVVIQSEERFRAVLDNMLEGAQILGFDWRYRYINQSAERHNQRPNGELLGQIYMDMWPGIENTFVYKMIKRCMEERLPWQMENKFTFPNGSTRWFELSIQPIPEGIFILSIDITERRQSQEIIKRSQETYQELFEGNPHPMWVYDLQTLGFLMVNDAAVEHYGYSRDEFLTMTIKDIRPVQDTSVLIEHMAKDLEPHHSHLEWRHVKKGGQVIDVEITSHTIQFEGRPARLVLANDITERKQAEEKLRHNEQRFRAMIENGLDYISLLDAEGTLLWESPANVRMLGYEMDEFVGKDIFQLVHPEDLEITRREFTELLKDPGNQRYATFRLKHADGTFRWVETVGSNLLENPSIAAVVLNYRDITSRKQAEEYIQYQANLLANVSDAIIACDMNSRITSWNPAAEEIYGWQADEVIGRPISNFLLNKYESGLEETQIKQEFLENGIWRGEVTQTRRDGSTIAVLSSVSLVRDESNAPLAMVAINRDITERKQHEKELQSMNAELERHVAERTAELERANRTKDEFLANMSHELRTPLNSILGLSESLLEQRQGVLNDHQQKSLKIVEDSGRHLLDLINDVLDLSKIEAGKFDYYPQVLSIDDVCRSSLAFIKAQAAKKSIRVDYSNQASVVNMVADSRRLKQILVNLLTNAVKFTPEKGRVTLEVKTDLDNELIQFSVIDTGVGIAAADMQRLFKPFVQLDSSLNRQYQGTGLGLALVQKLVDLHGGSICVESEVGKGSCFTVNLACQREIRAQMEGPAQERPGLGTGAVGEGKGRPDDCPVILLAEDNMPNILTITEYLKSYEYKVEIAHDGLEALAKADEVSPALILMDIQMPAMNGLEAIAHLRTNPRFALTPIIALTALAMPGDRERCLAAGASDYLSKPVSLKGLRNSIETMLRMGKG